MTTTPAPSGCAHCGIERRDHCQRWTAAAGWHGYTAPMQAQIKDRMNARRQARANARTWRELDTKETPDA